MRTEEGAEGAGPLLASASRFFAASRAVKEALPTAHEGKKVIVVGAGLAGLCAAYELKGLGYDVEVYEARERVGGRVHSLHDFVTDAQGMKRRAVEGGGELIGSNHPLWCSYKKLFHFRFEDTKDYGNAPVRVGGRTLTFEESAELTDEMEKYYDELNSAAEKIVDAYEPWTNPDAKDLDKTSLASWLDSLPISRRIASNPKKDGKLDIVKTARDGVAESLTTDNGVSADEQSMLGVLAMIKGGGIDRYWTDTEVYRCDGGNQRLAEKFRDELGHERVHLNTCVTKISREANRKVKVELQRTLQKPTDERSEVERGEAEKIGKEGHSTDSTVGPVYADDVILAVPPGVWNRIKSDHTDLQAKLDSAPRMGANVKYLMKFERRFWQDFSSAPTLTDDKGPADLTWETTEALHGPEYTMVAFSGAEHATEMAEMKSDKDRDAKYLEQLGVVYPGMAGEIKERKFMNWPEEEWTKGSYYFPRTGEVTKWGPFWRSGYAGWLHFAGEHTCYAFMGYMEGALASGFRLARRLGVRDGL